VALRAVVQEQALADLMGLRICGDLLDIHAGIAFIDRANLCIGRSTLRGQFAACRETEHATV